MTTEGDRMMAKIGTTASDAADYLDTAEAIAAYLDVYLEDGTPEELRTALATVARSHGVADLSARSGITRQGIYKALGQDGNPSFVSLPGLDSGIRAILSAMGLRLTEPAEPDPQTVTAQEVMSRRKQALRDLDS